MQIDKYLIKKDKTDLLSSLSSLNKDIFNEKLKEFNCKDINELKEDMFTILYFKKIISNENSIMMAPYMQDTEDLLVFVYEQGNHYSYYIPTEIKEIINKILKLS